MLFAECHKDRIQLNLSVNNQYIVQKTTHQTGIIQIAQQTREDISINVVFPAQGLPAVLRLPGIDIDMKAGETTFSISGLR